MKLSVVIGFLGCFLLLACKSEKRQSIYALPLTMEEGIPAVIEIPAGTNHKIEYNKETETFECDKIDGKDRVINFLPYPGNYGFIPSTFMDEEQGGDGDALDILVIAESQKTGAVIQVKPIASLSLKDGGEIDTKIIAVPIDSSLQIIQAQNFQEFAVEYPAAQRMIQEWFLNYKGIGKIEFLGWHNEQVALATIRKWKK